MFEDNSNNYPTDNSASLQQLTLEQAMQLAEQHQASGNLQQADQILRQILQAQPKHALALHLLGIITHQSGNTELATQLITQAIDIRPDMALFHSNIGEMYRMLGRLDEAIIHGDKAVSIEPGNASAHSNLGIAWYDKDDLDRAEICQKKALSIHPSLIAALNNMGSICRNRKELEAAEKYYRKVLAIVPQHLESMNNLGAVLTEREQPEKSVELIQQALILSPDYADAHHNIAIAWLILEQEEKTEMAFNRELQLRPNAPEPYQGLAQLHLSQKNLTEAEKMARKAFELAPDKAEIHSILGDIHTQAGFPDKAETDYAHALELDGKLENAHLGKGHLLMEQGEMDAAKTSFQRALELNVDGIGAKLALVQSYKVTDGDENMTSLIQEGEKIDTMLETKAMSLHFALGKGFDDTKQYNKAFPHFLEGCRLRRKRIEYSTEANDKYVDNIISFFSSDHIKQLRSEACTSDLPIFVLGMPRSGTTLTEQIIASHPDVHGAGELPDLLDISGNPQGNDFSDYPQSLTGITQAELKIMGNRYVTGLAERNPKAARITDKMPANFNCLGLIHLMLPNAKIIHIKRNPVDTCLSNFTKLFGHKSQPQSYDLTEIGLYYRNYARLMDHWREVLPKGSFYEVEYEKLVVDNENQAKALIDYCQLDWDDACLNFHKTKRIVRTASITQVRQPIYNTSVERWRKYETYLEPLLDALGDLVPR
jgi:tetratricopeptide (TPR) repeat protein